MPLLFIIHSFIHPGLREKSKYQQNDEGQRTFGTFGTIRTCTRVRISIIISNIQVKIV